jgi:hypothetical protein
MESVGTGIHSHKGESLGISLVIGWISHRLLRLRALISPLECIDSPLSSQVFQFGPLRVLNIGVSTRADLEVAVVGGRSALTRLRVYLGSSPKTRLNDVPRSFFLRLRVGPSLPPWLQVSLV